MAKLLTTSWQEIATYNWQPGTGFNITFYLDAKYSSQSIENNTTTINTRLRSVIHAGSGSGSNYEFTCSYANSVSGSGTWYFTNETITSGTGTETHNDDGAKTLTLYASGRVNGVGLSFAISGEVTLPTIARATKIGDVTATIGTSKTIKWTKASSIFTHKLTYIFGDKSGTIGTNLVDSVAWTPPTSLYEEIPNSPSGTGTLKLTTYNGSTQIGSTQTSVLTINANNNSKPVFQSSSVVDANTSTIALTGDEAVLVKNMSNAKVSFTFDTKEYSTAKKITINGKSITIPSGTLQTDNKTTRYVVNYTFKATTTNEFAIIITDSRDKTNTVTKTATMVNYIKLDAKYNFKRQQPTNGKVVLDFEGNYFNDTFGQVANTLSISYVYKKSTETNYSEVIPFVENTDYKISGNKYYSGTGSSKNQIVLEPTFDYKYVYDVQVYVEDKLTKIITNVTIVKGIPIMWWNGEKVTVNGDLYIADEDGQNEVKVSDVWSVGSVYVTSTNTNPSTKFGGTWELIDKEFRYAYQYSSGNVFLESGEDWTQSTTYITRSGHTITIRQNSTNNVDLTDSATTIGTLNFDKLGITGLHFARHYLLGYSDGGNGGIVCSLAYNTGILTQADIFNSTSIPAGGNFYLDIILPVTKNLMKDEYCDKFYWKRTA